MPYMTNGKRDYDREYKEYHASEKEKNKRVLRNAARREFARMGLVRKGDGKDVDHKKPLSKGGNNASGNLRVRSAHSNRSYARTSTSAIRSY
jgi:hypothetical protein